MKIISREEIEKEQALRAAYSKALAEVMAAIEAGTDATALKEAAVKAGEEAGVKDIDFDAEYKHYQARKAREAKMKERASK